MSAVSELERRVVKIEQRNYAVEKDKAWETSWTRRFAVIFLTYISLGLYMQAIGVYQPWLNSIIPSVGFYLSTLTLLFLRSYWEKHIYKR